MATILNASIDLTKIPKEAIINGKKGKYANISITIKHIQVMLKLFGLTETTLSQLLEMMHKQQVFNQHPQLKKQKMIYRFNKFYDAIEDKWVYIHYDEDNNIILKEE